MNMQDQSLYNLLTYSSIKEGLNISQKLKQQVTSEEGGGASKWLHCEEEHIYPSYKKEARKSNIE